MFSKWYRGDWTYLTIYDEKNSKYLINKLSNDITPLQKEQRVDISLQVSFTVWKTPTGHQMYTKDYTENIELHTTGGK